MDFTHKQAVVTGASSGIGRAFARELAARGAAVALVAQNEAELQIVATEIKRTVQVETLIIPMDLSRPDGPKRVFQALAAAGWQVDVLINAAGFGTRGPSHQLNPVAEHAQAMVNAVAVAQLSYLALPHMVKQHEGVIVNVGSSSGSFWPAPTMAMYGATKAFVLSFTSALWGEYHKQGLRITTLCPGPTDTAFHRAAGFTAGGTTSPAANKPKRMPEQAVQAAFRALEHDRPYIVDGWRSYLRALLPRLLTVRRASKLAYRSIARPASSLQTDDH